MRPSGPYPELLTSRSDVAGSAVWQVEAGPAIRGEAWTDVLGHAMRVPFGSGDHGRLVRAHELMHARVSPAVGGALGAWPDLGTRSVECAEEFRVNHLLERLGFDLADLRDGSERLSGTRLAEGGEWGEAVRFSAALAGTKAARDLLSGMRRVNPSWAAACRDLERELVRHARSIPTSRLAATTASDGGLPDGFATHTRRFAELIEDRAGRPVGAVDPSSRRARARLPSSGEFAPLLLDARIVIDRAIPGSSCTRRAPAAAGGRIVHPGRLATDPGRRIFDRPAHRAGGVVVVDQSGSMALDRADLEELLAAAPGAFVLGYSHAPGSTGVANAWILADRGRAASVVRSGNVGNGVDGPALRFALSRRRGREPFLWVCDGQVTDSNDHADGELAAQCARLVRTHRITMVATVAEALAVLRGPRRAPRSAALGRVAAAMRPWV